MNNLTQIGTDILFIMLHLFAFLANYSLFKKKLFHPSVLFSFIWFSILLFHFIIKFTILDKLFPLSLNTYIIFFVGIVCFSVGAVLQTIFLPFDRTDNSLKIINQPPSVELNKYFCLLCTIVIAVGLPFFIRACYLLFLQSTVEEFFIGLRTEICYGDVDIGPTKYLMTLAFIVFGLNCLLFFTSERKQDKRFSLVLLIFSLLINVVYIIFSTGRLYYVMLIAIYFGTSFCYNKKFSLRSFFIVGAFFLLLFSIVGVAIYSKGGDANDSLQENTKSAVTELSIYAFAPLSAFNWQIENEKPDETGDRTLRFFKKILKETGVSPNTVVRPILEEYAFVPYATNVYTLYSPYIGDFGRVYAWLIVGLFGFFHTMFFNKLKTSRSIRFPLYYGSLLQPLFLSIFADQYFSILSMWIQIFVFVEIFCLVNKIFNSYITKRQDNFILMKQI
jgi:oligosaccharide repeat unit polymerase